MNYCDGVGQKGLVDCDPENGQCEICYMADLEEENEKLKAENESLRADAGRYRHLRECNSSSLCVMQFNHRVLLESDADEAIDAAMGKGEQS